MGLTLEELKGKTVSVNAAAQITGLDRRTIKKYLDECEVGTDKETGEYSYLDVVRALIRASKGQNSADRRNDAQAYKLELECSLLEGKSILIEEAVAINRAYLGAVNRTIQASDMDEESKLQLVERLHNIKKEIFEEFGMRVDE